MLSVGFPTGLVNVVVNSVSFAVADWFIGRLETCRVQVQIPAVRQSLRTELRANPLRVCTELKHANSVSHSSTMRSLPISNDDSNHDFGGETLALKPLCNHAALLLIVALHLCKKVKIN